MRFAGVSDARGSVPWAFTFVPAVASYVATREMSPVAGDQAQRASTKGYPFTGSAARSPSRSPPLAPGPRTARERRP